MQIIIGLCGKAGSGKDTVADIITKKCFKNDITCTTIHFAKALKNIAKTVFGWDGQKDERGRRLLQVIGTDCARAYDKDFWIKKWEELLYWNQDYKVLLVPDVRFENEANAIHIRNGILIKVFGRAFDLGENANHASEAGLSKELIDYTIDNSLTIEALEEKVEFLLNSVIELY